MSVISTASKPKLSLVQIINMSMGFLGIQMAFGLQNGNASRILANFGADVHQLSWFWLVAPLTGLIVQPIIGHLGDHTWTVLGRRKPYFLIGAVFCALGLVFLPNAASVTTFIGANVLLLAVLFLTLMDASVNVSMEPFRALVGDMLPKEQGTLGFSVQTILIGIGAVIGSTLPSLLTKMGVSNVAPEGYVPQNVIYSFYAGALILLITILYTIFTTREYDPDTFKKFAGQDRAAATPPRWRDIFRDMTTIPPAMWQLGKVQFFSWFALFTMWVFTTSAVATHHFGLSPDDTHSAAFNRAGDFVGNLFGLYNLFAIPFAFLLIPLAKKIGKKQTHAVALLAGGIGLLLLYFIKNTGYLWISMVGIGFAWASILAMPYAMLIETIPQHKMGVYMGIFNFFIVIPQIVNGIIGGPVVSHLMGKQAIYYLMIGGVLMVLGAISVLRTRISDPQNTAI
ncbi:MFS transporter [Niabella beijingensis]|uniref:MFS transporter n=1 Tax=Niabella beijingensis TaxID=2872700 RepID=UPI001CBD7F25|nr:MFS transporter [Niabella beijingensis]MBZ4187380.1 MFS transporter [Niabella beijingensis]